MDVDILSLCGCSDADGRKIMVWEAKLSDVEGCIELCNARTLSYTLPLIAKGAPILALLDELASRGLAPLQKTTTHSAECKLEFDRRNVCSKREYLKCVLCLPALLKAGLKEFDSAQTQSFYKLLLLNPAKAQPGLSFKEYKRLLSLEAGEVSCSITSLLKPPAPLAVTAPEQKALPDVVGDDAPESLETMLEKTMDGTVTPAKEDTDTDSSSSSSSTSSSSAHPENNVVGDEDQDKLPTYPTHILGQTLIVGKTRQAWCCGTSSGMLQLLPHDTWLYQQIQKLPIGCAEVWTSGCSILFGNMAQAGCNYEPRCASQMESKARGHRELH